MNPTMEDPKEQPYCKQYNVSKGLYRMYAVFYSYGNEGRGGKTHWYKQAGPVIQTRG